MYVMGFYPFNPPSPMRTLYSFNPHRYKSQYLLKILYIRNQAHLILTKRFRVASHCPPNVGTAISVFPDRTLKPRECK